jgi:hypothetical protein
MLINFPEIVGDKKKLNSFILPKDTIKKMEDLIESSLSNNKEMGFDLCKDNNNELMGDSTRIGTGHEIKSTRICTKGKYVGQFHTHPPSGGGSSDLSFFDLANIYNDGMGCVGGTLDGLIFCDIRKGEIGTKGKEKIVSEANKFNRKLLPDGKLRHTDKLEYDKSVKKLQGELFKTFLIAELYEEKYD